MARILMVAIALGTVNLAKGTIVHADPNNKDPRARWIFVNDEDSAQRLETAEIARRGEPGEVELALEELAAGVADRAEADARRPAPAHLELPEEAARPKSRGAKRAAKAGGKQASGQSASRSPAKAKAPAKEPAPAPAAETGENADDDIDAAPVSGGAAPAAE